MSPVFPGGNPNTFVPEVTKEYIEFSRKPENFAVSRIARIIPVTKSLGYYTKITAEECGRILDANLDDARWAYGARSPDFNDGRESFDFPSYQTRRFAWGFNLDDEASEQAAWPIVEQHGRTKMMQAMTARTQKLMTLAQATGTYDSTHYSAVASISGNSGRFDQSTTARSDIKRSLLYAAELILQDSMGVANMEDLIFVCSPNCARQMAMSQEIIDYIKGSPEALAQVRGELSGGYSALGLPSKLHGIEVVVDKTYKVTSKKGATVARSEVCTATKPFLCTRPGGVKGIEGSQNEDKTFSTFSYFMKEELKVEEHREKDNWDRMLTYRVTEDYDTIATAPVTGFLFTSAVA